MVEVSDVWKSKGPVRNSSLKAYNTHQRLFVPADNVDRQPEDGCMKKIKIERSLKLRQEDFKNRGKYDIISGKEQQDSAWIQSFGKQAAGHREARTVRANDEAQRDHWAKTLNINTTSAAARKTNPII